MEQVVTFLAGMTYWHWLALGAVLVILEILTPTFYLIWPGIAAVLVGVLHIFMPDLGWQASLTIFGVLAVGATVVWHTIYRKGRSATYDDGRGLNKRVQGYLGRRATVAVAFQNGRGPILLDDSRWEAISEAGADLAPGSTVEIVGFEGATLRVRAA